MKTLTKAETTQVSGGIIRIISAIYEHILTEAFIDMYNGNLEALGELENRPVGTRP